MGPPLFSRGGAEDGGVSSEVQNSHNFVNEPIAG